jgi:hypothetical protein
MKTAATALGGILASIAIPDRVRSAGSLPDEPRPNDGQASPQAPRSGAGSWIGAPSALWRRLHAAGAAKSKKSNHEEHEGSAMTANSRVTRYTITLAVYVALQLGSVVLGIAISHKPAATSGSVIALQDAPKLPIDISEAF